jgi:metallophosphoesterase superfamily enzyme
MSCVFAKCKHEHDGSKATEKEEATAMIEMMEKAIKVTTMNHDPDQKGKNITECAPAFTHLDGDFSNCTKEHGVVV